MLKKKISLVFACLFTLITVLSFIPGRLFADGDIAVDATHFPDRYFRIWITENITGGSNVLTADMRRNTTAISCKHAEISDFTGIEYFYNLESFDCTNQMGDVINVKNPTLRLDVSNNTKLKKLVVSRNILVGGLDVSSNTALEGLNCTNCGLTSLDVSMLTGLKSLWCNDNPLSTISVSSNTALTNLNCSNNNLSVLDISNNTALTALTCTNNSLDRLDISNNPLLTSIRADSNNLSSIDISMTTGLCVLTLTGNSFTSVNISDCPTLINVYTEGYYSSNTRSYADFSNNRLAVEPNVEIITDQPSSGPRPAPPGPGNGENGGSEENGGSSGNSGENGGSSGSGSGNSGNSGNNGTSNSGNSSGSANSGSSGNAASNSGSNSGTGNSGNANNGSSANNGSTGATPTPTIPANTNPVSTAASEPGVAGFVERLYTVALGRNSDPAGKQNWIDAITLRGETGASAARGFLYSPEFLNKDASNEEFVAVLYRTFFDREPDQAGFNAWVGALRNGTPKQEVIEGFINSTEWANLCLRYGIASGGTGVPNIEVEPSTGTVDFCTRLYTTCLGRSADQNGLMAWARQLSNQRDTGTGAARGFFFSSEFTGQNLNNGEYVTRLYRTFMGREPDTAGYNAWVGQLDSGVSREEVFDGFAASSEFSAICASYGIVR